jgi:hypothetical protein
LGLGNPGITARIWQALKSAALPADAAAVAVATTLGLGNPMNPILESIIAHHETIRIHPLRFVEIIKTGGANLFNWINLNDGAQAATYRGLRIELSVLPLKESSDA